MVAHPKETVSIDTLPSEHLEVASLFVELGDQENPAPDPKSEPGATFRWLYDRWVARGGYVRGKPRHAVRQIKIWLGENQVRSLETKLAGKTRLQRHETSSLVRLFLERWTYNSSNNSYAPFSEQNLDQIIRIIIDTFFASDSLDLLLPHRSRTTSRKKSNNVNTVYSKAVEAGKISPSSGKLRDLFEYSDAQIIVSRARTVIGSDPAIAMTRFQQLMQNLHNIALKSHRDRALIWVVDMGLLNEKNAAHRAIQNLHNLSAQFRAIALIEVEARKLLYKWLRQSACFIVGSLKHEEIEWAYKHFEVKIAEDADDLRWFQSDRLFLESVPQRWLDAPGSEAFGQSQSELWRVPTVTAHLRLDNWDDLTHSTEVDVRKNLRYFLHDEVRPAPDDPDESSVNCIPLPEPGSRWSDAYRLACSAAFQRLGWEWDDRVGAVKPVEALAQLRHQHFAVFRLDEFLHLPDLLIEHAAGAV